MGYSTPFYWPILVLGQLVSLGGFGVTLFLQQSDRAALRELQFRLEIQAGQVRELSGKQSQAKSSGGAGGEPSGEPSSSGGSGPKTSKDSKGFEERNPPNHSWSFLTGLVIGIGVILLILISLVLCWASRGESGSLVLGSPVEKRRELAARQLAELRLKKHGFGQ